MKKILIILKKCFEKTLSSFWYGEDGNPPHALYISILATMILAVYKINKFTNNCSDKQFVLGITESLMASVFLAYIIDLSRYISDTITKKEKNQRSSCEIELFC